MSKAAHAKTAFTAGVLGPRVSRRVDTQHYFNGAKQLENFLCLPWGGIERAPGTIYANEVRDSSKAARLLEFIFSRRQAYLLQFNDSKIRFYKDRGTVFTAGGGVVITGITNANPGVVTTATDHGLENGDVITMSEVDGMEEVNGVEYTVANKTATTFELSGIDTTGFGTFIPHTGTVLLLHLNSDLTDSSSTTPHTVTAVGNAAVTASQSKFGSGALALDGTGDYLTVPDNADWDLGTGDFCIDFWVNFNSTAGDICFIDRNSGNDFRVALESGTLKLYLEGTAKSLGSWSPSTGVWYHVAVSRSGTTLRGFIDLVENGTGTSSADIQGTAGLFIGATSSGTNALNGYLDEFRITKGYARYAAGLSTNYKLLLHMDGTDGATTFTDRSPSARTMTANGNAQIDTALSKFGGASGLFDGSGDYVSAVNSADFDFGSGDFTIDFWYYPTASQTCGVMTNSVAGSNTGWSFLQTALTMQFGANGGSLVSMQSSGNMTVNAWNHIALTRSGSDWKLFINGVLQASATSAGSITASTDVLKVGTGLTWSGGSWIGTNDANGSMDEVRILKSEAAWTAAFTPPSTAYGGSVPTHEGYDQAIVGGIYEISHSYADDELFDIQMAQSADVAYLFHPDHPVMKLSRFDDDDWTLAEVDWVDGPYLDRNTTATTLDPSGTSGSVTVTASAVTGINDDEGFKTTDVGRLISYHDGTSLHYLKITAWTSTTVVTATVKGSAAMAGHAASTNWALGAWSATTGYPRTGTFHKGRLYAAGTSEQPQGIWGSVVLDFENMLDGSDDDDAVNVTLNTDRVNIIEWLASEKRLIAGTAGENFTIYSGFTNEPITPSNIQADPESSYGASSVPPEKIGSLLYYMDSDNRRLREFSYGFDIDRYRSINKSILSDHITGTGIVEMAFQQSPYGILYCVREDGGLATYTREVDQQIEGWTEQLTDGLYESVAVIPVEGYDEVWFIVQRTINGETKRYVEYQQNPYQAAENDLEDQILMHSSLTYDGSPTQLVTGLEHLEGETVYALCDGVEVEGVVTNGQLPLPAAYSKVHVGIEAVAKAKILPPEAASAIGTAQGLMKRISEVLVSVFRTARLRAGEEDGNMEEVLRDSGGEILETLQTDDFTVPGTLGWDKKSELYFEVDGAMPCTILLLVLFMSASEK